MLQFNRIFVTVGTTLFEDLIDVVSSDDILALLADYQCKHLILQCGAGRQIPSERIEEIQRKFNITLECYDYKAAIQSDIVASDLVISHAGAGSCMEVLNAKKHLIVVVNDKLMHNHQTELANQLYTDGYLLYCVPKTLAKTITELPQTISFLREYESGDSNMQKFINHLNFIMGFD